jgi:pimeloyl-ACP methyl ester carboxylesterase
MTSRHIVTNGVTLFAEECGDPEDPTILLIMGAMASGVWWPDDFCRQLASRGRYVIRYDHRDTGKSTSYRPGHLSYGVEDLGDDAVRVLDAYGIQRAHLVGMSLGGYLAQLIGLKYPARVHTLTLIASEALAPADLHMPGIDPAVLAYHSAASGLDWTKRAAVLDYQVGAWRLLSGSAHPFDESEIRAIAAADFDRTPNPASAFNHAALSEPVNWIGRLSQLRTPVLVIHGTEDRVVPYAHASTIKARVPAATLLPLQGTGHELHRADWPVILNAIEPHTARKLDTLATARSRKAGRNS